MPFALTDDLQIYAFTVLSNISTVFKQYFDYWLPSFKQQVDNFF